MKKFLGKTLTGKLVSVHAGDNEDLSKDTRESLSVEIGGFAGDRHQGPVQEAWEGEWEPAGTRRRNERQWSGISVEELTYITERLDLTEPLTPETLGANLCVSTAKGRERRWRLFSTFPHLKFLLRQFGSIWDLAASGRPTHAIRAFG